MNRPTLYVNVYKALSRDNGGLQCQVFTDKTEAELDAKVNLFPLLVTAHPLVLDKPNAD